MNMRYREMDFYPGIYMSCYLNPTYNPACLGCIDREECYGHSKYAQFRAKALAISKFLGDNEDIPPESAIYLAWVLRARKWEKEIQNVLESDARLESKLASVIKYSLGLNEPIEEKPKIRRFA